MHVKINNEEFVNAFPFENSYYFISVLDVVRSTGNPSSKYKDSKDNATFMKTFSRSYKFHNYKS